MIGSIRGRLLLVLGIAILIEGVAVGFAVYRFSLHEADELFDAQLARAARILAQMVEPFLELEDSPPGVTPLFSDAPGHPYERKLVYQVWSEEGVLLLRSRNAPAHRLAARDEGYHDLLIGDERWRVFQLHDAPRGLWFITGESAEIRGELSTEIALAALVPLAIGMLGLALAVWVACTFGLAGIRDLSGAVARRDPENLDPIDESRAPVELRPLVAALNRLMGRVHRAMRFERRFIADAAHELRTPLAALRVHLQNALEEHDPRAQQASLRQTAQALERLIRLVDHLLLLSRLDPDAPQLERSGFDVAALARETLAELEPLAASRGVSVALEDHGPARLTGVPEAFQSLIRNLVDNAIRHSPDGGRVTVTVTGDELVVADQGPGIPAAVRARVFDRFVRGEDGMSSGTGLGLSIVRRVAALHGASVELDATAEPGQVVRVCWGDGDPVPGPA